MATSTNSGSALSSRSASHVTTARSGLSRRAVSAPILASMGGRSTRSIVEFGGGHASVLGTGKDPGIVLYWPQLYREFMCLSTKAAERRETFGCVRGTRFACHDAARQALARRHASHDAGRSPLGAPPWRFWAPGRRFLLRHWRRISLAPAARCLARRVPGLPGPAVTSRRRRTPRLAPPSGSSLEDAPR
jgi:hypothetical protein